MSHGGSARLVSRPRRGTKRLPLPSFTLPYKILSPWARYSSRFLFLLARSTADDLQKQVEFLKAENEMLRKRVPRQRIFLKADERAQLLKLGTELGPSIRQLVTIVDYSTFRPVGPQGGGPEAEPGGERPASNRQGDPRIGRADCQRDGLGVQPHPG